MKALALILAACACAPAPMLVTRHCTPPPEQVGPARLDRCEDGACLYGHQERGIDCWFELYRPSCEALWDLQAHSCAIHSPDDPAEWELPESVRR